MSLRQFHQSQKPKYPVTGSRILSVSSTSLIFYKSEEDYSQILLALILIFSQNMDGFEK